MTQKSPPRAPEVRALALLVTIAALIIAAGSMACINTVQMLDNEDETDGAT